MTIPYILQVTDRWSKRRFVMKLEDSTEFVILSDFLQFLKDDSKKVIDELLDDKRISINGVYALEDIKTASFIINDDGSLDTLYDEVFFTIDGHMIYDDDEILYEKRHIPQSGFENTMVANIVLHRENLPFSRNWSGYYKRFWNEDYSKFILNVVQEFYPDDYLEILDLNSKEKIIKFWKAVSLQIYNAPYELYSRYLGRRVPFKTGPETLSQIMIGRGGNCSEKAAALDFIKENYNLDGRMILSGNDAGGNFPYAHLRNALNRGSTIFTGDNQKYWEHYANLFIVDGEKILVDATGGPMPFLFTYGKEAEEFLSQKRSQEVQFIAQRENYYYHDAPTDITYDAFFNMEAFLVDVDLYHIFGPEDEDSPFGLYIRPDLWICPNAYKTDDEYIEHMQSWREYAELSESIIKLEMYLDLNHDIDKSILTELEKDEPNLIEDIRKADPVFQKRCRYLWRDDTWKISYVFCKIKPKNDSYI